MSDNLLQGLNKIKSLLTTDSNNDLDRYGCRTEYVNLVSFLLNRSLSVIFGLDKVKTIIIDLLKLENYHIPHDKLIESFNKVDRFKRSLNAINISIGSKSRHPHLVIDDLIKLHLTIEETLVYTNNLYKEINISNYTPT